MIRHGSQTTLATGYGSGILDYPQYAPISPIKRHRPNVQLLSLQSITQHEIATLLFHKAAIKPVFTDLNGSLRKRKVKLKSLCGSVKINLFSELYRIVNLRIAVLYHVFNVFLKE